MAEISNVVYVFNDGKAIHTKSPLGADAWFYRIDGDFVTYNPEQDLTTEVARSTVEANVFHDDTEIETVPVEESPFDV